MVCICFYVFLKCPSNFFPWTDLDDRQTNTQLPEVCFLCFYVFNFAYMDQVIPSSRQLLQVAGARVLHRGGSWSGISFCVSSQYKRTLMHFVRNHAALYAHDFEHHQSCFGERQRDSFSFQCVFFSFSISFQRKILLLTSSFIFRHTFARETYLSFEYSLNP